MRFLVLGANGQVGFELLRALAPLGEVAAATRSGELDDGARCLQADLADPISLARALFDAEADVIVNAAAYTAVDRAEDEPDLADCINHRAVGELATFARERGALFVHYSTDYVFAGAANRPYREDDATDPLGIYGGSKLAGEDALRASGAAHLIFRTAWVYAARGANFLRTMLRLAAERNELRIVADQIGAPTPARWIAEATAAAIVRRNEVEVQSRSALDGIYHLVAGGQCSWCDFAEAIMQEASARGLLAHVPRILPIPTSAYPTRAQRPAWSVLDCAKLENTFGLQLPDWKDGLRTVLDEVAGRAVPSPLFR